jgi:hypothetical protein
MPIYNGHSFKRGSCIKLSTQHAYCANICQMNMLQFYTTICRGNFTILVNMHLVLYMKAYYVVIQTHYWSWMRVHGTLHKYMHVTVHEGLLCCYSNPLLIIWMRVHVTLHKYMHVEINKDSPKTSYINFAYKLLQVWHGDLLSLTCNKTHERKTGGWCCVYTA